MEILPTVKVITSLLGFQLFGTPGPPSLSVNLYWPFKLG